jgi:MFS family permease
MFGSADRQAPTVRGGTLNNAWQRNLRLFVAYRAGVSLLVYIAISLPFYQSLGFDLTQIGALYSANALTILLLDIPTGFIADRPGFYRRMLMAGVGIQALAFGLLAVTFWQWPVLFLQVLLGIGQAISRGADGPLARLSADAIGADFGRYARFGVAAMGIAEGVASLGTVALAWARPHDGPRLAMLLQAIIYLLVLYIPWRMHEERPAIPLSVKMAEGLVRFAVSRVRRLVATVHDELRTNREARWLLLYGATIGCTTQTVVNLVQPYFQMLHLATWQYGLWWTAYHWLWAGFSLMSGWYERLWGRWGALASLVGWGMVTNAVMATVHNGFAGLVTMVVFYFVRGVQMPLILDYMTGVIRADRRATMLSVQTTVHFAMFSVMNIILGYTAQHYGVRAAFGVSFAVYGVLGVLFVGLLKRTAR